MDLQEDNLEDLKLEIELLYQKHRALTTDIKKEMKRLTRLNTELKRPRFSLATKSRRKPIVNANKRKPLSKRLSRADYLKRYQSGPARSESTQSLDESNTAAGDQISEIYGSNSHNDASSLTETLSDIEGPLSDVEIQLPTFLEGGVLMEGSDRRSSFWSDSLVEDPLVRSYTCVSIEESRFTEPARRSSFGALDATDSQPPSPRQSLTAITNPRSLEILGCPDRLPGANGVRLAEASYNDTAARAPRSFVPVAGESPMVATETVDSWQTMPSEEDPSPSSPDAQDEGLRSVPQLTAFQTVEDRPLAVQVSKIGISGLHLAARRGDAKGVRLSLLKGLGSNARDEQGKDYPDTGPSCRSLIGCPSHLQVGLLCILPVTRLSSSCS